MYASKKMKFKQGRLLAALGNGDLGDDVQEEAGVMAWASDGVCAALSANWLKHNASLHGNRVDAIVAGVNAQFLYSAGYNNSPNAFMNSIGLVSVTCNIPFVGDIPCPEGDERERFKRQMKLWLKHDIGRNPVSAYIGFDIHRRADGLRVGGHAVAATKKRGSPMDFFEPNAGWYEVLEGKEPEFCKVLAICYYDLGYQVRAVKIQPVKHKSVRKKLVEKFS